MVGRRRVLLSVAVLGVEAVFGGPLGRRENVDLNNTGNLPVVPARPPPINLTRATLVEITASIRLGGGDEGGAQQTTSPSSTTTTPPTRPGAPPGVPTPKPALTVEQGSVAFDVPVVPQETTTLPSRPTGGPPGIPAPQAAATVEEAVDFGGGATPAAVPTLPTRPGGAPPAIPTTKGVTTLVDVTSFAGGTTSSTTSAAAPPGRPGGGGPPVAPKPPVTLEEEVVDFGKPTTTSTTTSGPPRPGGGPPTGPPAKVIEIESTFDFGGGDEASPTTDYSYPGDFGSGILITATGKGEVTPPPFITTQTPRLITTTPVRPPGAQIPGSDSDSDSDGDGPVPNGAQVTPAPQKTLTFPRGDPPPRNTTSVSSFGMLTQSSSVSLSEITPEPTPEPTPAPSVSTMGDNDDDASPISLTPCVADELERLQTTYSVVYTSTLTWFGNPEDYTPLYPPIETPPAPNCRVSGEPARMTATTYEFCSTTGTGTKFVTCLLTTSSWIYSGNKPATTEAYMAPGYASDKVTVVTTDKNPAVVYPTKRAPNYGVTSAPRTQDTHLPVTTPVENNTPPGYNQGNDNDADGPANPAPVREPPATLPPVTVGVKPSAVVINDHTISDLPSGQSQVVIVAGVTFTINPSQVIGGGSTIDRNSITGGGPAPTPTSTQIGNIDVIVSSSVAVVGGSSFTLGSTTTTAVVSGTTVVIQPSAVVVGSQTVSVPTVPRPTEVVVAGGDLITAIGQSVAVIKSTTITYGLAGTSTTVIDNDTITFGPGGVTVHGTTLGGTSAKPGATDFAVAGGATITKIGASVVVVGGSTYTVGPGSGSTTTVVGGETITIGPNGVKVSTLTLPWPFGPTTVITPKATPTQPSATAAEASEDAAPGLRPDGNGFLVAGCLALGMFWVGL